MPNIPTFRSVKDSLPPSTWTDPFRAYSTGYVGTWADPEATEKLRSDVISAGGYWHAEDVAYAIGAAGQGMGKLCLLTEEIAAVFGRPSMPGPAQRIGDCVTHNLKNAILGTLSSNIRAGQQGKPNVAPEGIGQGILSTEVPYWWRGHSGDGWSCDDALEVAMKHAGAVLRQNYPDAKVDLTRYSDKIAHRFGASPPDRKTAEVFNDNLVTSVTRCRSWEETRDMIAAGQGLSSCGSEGFENVRDDWGVSRRQGRWAHAIAVLGCDDRPETWRRYGCGLILAAQSWGPNWNSGPTRIYGTNLEIPPGYFWARWDDWKNRTISAVSTVQGWRNNRLRDWKLRDFI
jgi:hypothetical protein